MELSENESLRFDGYDCAHFIVANDTGYTRISFAFRVVPTSLKEENKPRKIGDHHTETTGPVTLNV
jgi:hypothetical protein